MPEPDRSLAARIHEIVKAAAPALASKTWYGMPAYTKDGKTICFVQVASKFNVRYSTLGFQPDARLDDGAMWPNAFAVLELTPEVEERIAALVRQAGITRVRGHDLHPDEEPVVGGETGDPGTDGR
jgi:uncharacterized protein YdhG (YjbR/CyaY superfamily)